MAYYQQSPVAVAQHFYPQPTQAYHPAPTVMSHHHSKSRGHRLCDTCGKIETPQSGRFRLCGGCMVTQYCSPECQKMNWPQHKMLCRHTADQMAATKQQASMVGPTAEFPDQNLAKSLRKFTSAHSDLFGWSVFQALQLKRMPSNIRQYALQIQLAYCNSSDSSRRFTISNVQLISRSVINNTDPVVISDVTRREERCRRAGGIGVAIVMLQCGLISQVMPVEVDPPSKITWDSREDWEQILRMYVDAGRTDFRAPTSGRR